MAIGKHVVTRAGTSPVVERRTDDDDDWNEQQRTTLDPHTPVDQRFLLRLRDNPDDHAMRAVYADWLEEREQHGKAELVRLLAKPAEQRTSRDLVQLRRSAHALPPEWRAIVTRAPIDKCDVRWKLKCPKSWEALASTDDARIRHCGTCQRDVYFCADLEEVRQRGRAGHCVAFCATLDRGVALDEYDGDNMIEMGEIA